MEIFREVKLAKESVRCIEYMPPRDGELEGLVEALLVTCWWFCTAMCSDSVGRVCFATSFLQAWIDSSMSTVVVVHKWLVVIVRVVVVERDLGKTRAFSLNSQSRHTPVTPPTHRTFFGSSSSSNATTGTQFTLL